MSKKQLIVPSAFWAFYETKKEGAITKEEEHFFQKVFQYALRMISGLSCTTNRNSLNQKALLRTAHIWIKEYEDFKKGYTDPHLPKTTKTENRMVLTKQKMARPTKADTFSEAIKEVLNGQVYTADNQFTMMRVRINIYNEKRRGEHKYPRYRD